MNHHLEALPLTNGSLPVPDYFRVLSVMRLPGKNGKGVYNEATLYHDDLQRTVCWHTPQVDIRLKRGSLVMVDGWGRQAATEQPHPVRGLRLFDKPLPTINPFRTIPPSWVADRNAVNQAADLWMQLDRPLQHLLNADLWDAGRFYRFVTGPASAIEADRQGSGNFRRAVATAVQARQLAGGMVDVSQPVVIAAALLFAAGKADDYRRSSAGFVLSERGQWIGYQHTILEWLAVARGRVIVPETQYLKLVHALIAARGESVTGKSMEAMILSVAQRGAEALSWWPAKQPTK